MVLEKKDDKKAQNQDARMRRHQLIRELWRKTELMNLWMTKQEKMIQGYYRVLARLREEIFSMWRMIAANSTKCRNDFMRYTIAGREIGVRRLWMVERRIYGKLKAGRKLFRRIQKKTTMAKYFGKSFLQMIRDRTNEIHKSIEPQKGQEC
uniref:Uncharacterized protein n=1 Tax=Lutzomyia longipalpis TaxID=7200 RepID=A0A1B0CGN9_LUTLO